MIPRHDRIEHKAAIIAADATIAAFGLLAGAITAIKLANEWVKR